MGPGNGIRAAGITTALLALLLLCMLGGCAHAEMQEGPTTMEEWGRLYPLQYGSYAEPTVKGGMLEGHHALKAKLLAPAERVVRSDGQVDTKLINNDGGYGTGVFVVHGLEWDPVGQCWFIPPTDLDDLSATRMRKGCYSCKTKSFDSIYQQEGAQIFTERIDAEFVLSINGQVWSCGTCHDGDPAQNPADAQLTYWTQLSRDAFWDLAPKERVCGQCHNSLDHRSRISDQAAMDSFSPYRYGFGIDALYAAAMEDGIYREDPQTGVLLTCLDHPDVEFTQGSPMAEVGLTCVDCHMPTAIDEPTGMPYTFHGASSSPLENQASLEFCLTCHCSQGIGSPEEMVKMVRELQGQAARTIAELDGLFSQAYALLAEQTARQSVDDCVLESARADYSLAEAYYHATKGGRDDGAKAVHNPPATERYYARCGDLLRGIVTALGGE